MPRKAGAAKVDPNETKEQKFIRLAVPRLNKSVKAISSLGKLAGPGYESTPAMRTKILEILSGELKKVQAQFAGETNGKTGFTAEDLIVE